jgi:dihydropteroate synthase
MGILNVTPDSFSDGGRFQALDQALRHAEQMLQQGALILDIGGESTRPGATEVSAQEELDRVLPVIEAVHQRMDCVISVDTMKPLVMTAAVVAGAEIINDVNALEAEGAIAAAVTSQAAVCLMHRQGNAKTMQLAPAYDSVVAEVRAYLSARLQVCIAAGISADSLLLDPGIGFGKSLDHNLRLLAALESFHQLGVPVLLGVSRKSMFQHLLGLPVAERMIPSVATAILAAAQGVQIIRCHDVGPTVLALKTASAILERRNLQC